MTKKEERIAIINNVDEINEYLLDNDLNPMGKLQITGITRAEAVERLAKVQWDRDRKHNSALNKDIVMPPWDEVERPSPSTELYLQDAQAALDALLES